MTKKTSRATYDVADRLHSATLHLLRRLRRVDEVTGIKSPALSALSVLVFGGPKKLGELADAEQVRPATMTRLVQHLEASGLVRKKSDAADRRAVRLEATPKAVAVLKRGRSERVKMLAVWLGELEAGELAELNNAAALIERLGAASPNC